MTPEEREKLSKVLAMLSSPYDGEAVAAARRAEEMLKTHGLRFADLRPATALPPPPPPDPPPPRPRKPTVPGTNNLKAVAAFALVHAPDRLNEWEREFCRSVARQRRISRRQAHVLHRIRGRMLNVFGDDCEESEF